MTPHALAATVVINPNIPFTPSNSTIGGMIQGFYLFALAISGILAFGAIVYGGIKYATGRGNPSSESEGKSWVTNALLGLLLLAGAYVVLQTVNPGLVLLANPSLPALGRPSSTSITLPSGSGTLNGVTATCGPNYGACPSGQTCTQSTNQTWGCLTSSGPSKSTNPVCSGVTAGCTVYYLPKGSPSNCNGYGSSFNSCTNGVPPSSAPAGCFTSVTC